jgi:hypothetical protein
MLVLVGMLLRLVAVGAAGAGAFEIITYALNNHWL